MLLHFFEVISIIDFDPSLVIGDVDLVVGTTESGRSGHGISTSARWALLGRLELALLIEPLRLRCLCLRCGSNIVRMWQFFLRVF